MDFLYNKVWWTLVIWLSCKLHNTTTQILLDACTIPYYRPQQGKVQQEYEVSTWMTLKCITLLHFMEAAQGSDGEETHWTVSVSTCKISKYISHVTVFCTIFVMWTNKRATNHIHWLAQALKIYLSVPYIYIYIYFFSMDDYCVDAANDNEAKHHGW